MKDDSFAIVNHLPASNAKNISLVTKVDIELNAAVMRESIQDDFITVSSPRGVVEGYVVEVDDRRFRFTPYDPLAPDTRYRVSTAAIMSADGLENEVYEWEFSTTANIGTTPQDVIDSCMNERDIAMLAAVNEVRLKARKCDSVTYSAVTPLKWNCKLRQAAQAHADDMAAFDFVSHQGTDGFDPGDRVSAADYRWTVVRENVAGGQSTIAEVMKGLLNSRDHCTTIMANNVEEFGFGYSENRAATYRFYWTQVFGSPRK